MTTIRISLDNKAYLDKLKVHPREPYDDVLKRFIDKLKGRNEKDL